MKLKYLLYKINYTIRNYYIDHKIIVLFPCIIAIGFVLGVISAIHSNSIIANFVDCTINDELNLSGAFAREFFLVLLIGCMIFTVTLNRFCHIFGVLSLIHFGYKAGYLITSILKGGGFYSVVHIILINVPFFLFSSICIIFFYSYIMTIPKYYCISRTKVIRSICVNILIYLIIYTLIIVWFHILTPRIYIAIFLS